MSYPTNFILENNHPLIARHQNYFLNRKLLTVHSEDRDTLKWPNANEFEIICPESYTNIQSIRLVESSIPCNYYNFSQKLQNTKFSFRITLTPQDYFTGTTPITPTISLPTGQAIVAYLAAHPIVVDLSDGYYQLGSGIGDLANSMAFAMNQAATKAILQASGLTSISQIYDGFHVRYNIVKQKLVIANNRSNFILHFNERFTYDLSACINQNKFDQANKWGFPSYIGFYKKEYPSSLVKDISSTSPLIFAYESETPESFVFPYATKYGYPHTFNKSVYYVESPCTVDIFGPMSVYMELEKYNSYDELKPYPTNTSNLYNNSYNGSVNSAFAKLQLTDIPKTQIFDSLNGYLINISTFDPPLERVSKFKFKFRYHDGTLLDFKCNDLNFTLEINQLRNEITKKMNIRVPASYNVN